MIETNIRIVGLGTNLYLWTRCTKIKAPNPSPKMLEKACNKFASQGLDGQTYNSLLEYYQHNQSQLRIDPNDSVARVSFPNIDQPQPVAAKLLRLRVMNDALPKSLKHVDKIKPWERVRLINSFWERLENDVLRNGKPRVS